MKNHIFAAFLTLLIVLTLGCSKNHKESVPEIIRGVWRHRNYFNPSIQEFLQYDRLAYTYTFEKNRVFIDDYNFQNREKYHVSDVDSRDSQDSTIYIFKMYKWVGSKKAYATRTFCYKKALNILDMYTLNDDGSLTKGNAYFEKVY